MTELTAQTPAEIDAQLFKLLQAQYRAEDDQSRALEILHVLVGDRKPSPTWADRHPTYKLSTQEVLDKAAELIFGSVSHDLRLDRELAAYDGAVAKRAELAEQAKPFNAEYERRGGWTRAYLVDNVDGHLHKSTRCSTLHNGLYMTRLHWITEVSGHDEAEIVEGAGEKACTVCYPSAPVDVLKRASKFEGPNMQAAREAREVRAAEKAAREAKKNAKAILPDGSDLVFEVAGHRERVSTLVSAWNTLVGYVYHYAAYGYQPHVEAQAVLLQAIAAKLGQSEDETRELLQAKVIAKAKREGTYGTVQRVLGY